MEKELEILSSIEENENVTQRILAAKTGLSLGAINLLLRKMIETGLIKIEKLNTRTVRYILTPKGMIEKAKKTYDYVKRTYESIMRMKSEIYLIVESLPRNSTLYLYGEDDEVYHMVTMFLAEAVVDKGIVLKEIKTAEEIDNKSIVIVWNSADADKFARAHCINILDSIL